MHTGHLSEQRQFSTREPILSLQQLQNGGHNPLPSKVWENIFQHVSVLQLLEFRLICRSWRAIVDGSPALMNRIRIKFPPGFALDRDYEPEYLVPARNLTLEKVRISAVNTWWSTFAQRLVFVSISDCRISCSTLLQLLQPMTNLKVLHLGAMRMSKSSKVAVNFQMKQVETLSGSFSEEMLRFLVPIFTQLKRIDILRILEPTLAGISLRFTPEILNEILQCKHLTHLIVQTGRMDNEDLTAIGNELTNLTCIQVQWSSETTTQPTFLEAMPKLEEICLNASFTEWLDFAELKNPKLTRFKLNYSRPVANALFRYLDNSPEITDICFRGCQFSSWSQVFAVLEIFCHTLQRLELQSLDLNGGGNLSEYFDSLRYLKLGNCELDRTLLMTFLSLCPRLEEVHLEFISSVDDEVVLFLCQKSKHLEILTLDCYYITDSSADYIVEHCHTLKQLSIQNFNLTNDAKEKLNRMKYEKLNFT